MDYVVIAGLVRSPMGVFQALYEPGAQKRWNMPKEADIADCKVAAIDPYFQEETRAVAELCKKYGKPYVTIDCCHDNFLHQNCAINVVSKECTNVGQYQGKTLEEVYDLGNEYDGAYPDYEPELSEVDETPEVSDSHLKLCPECGKESFDLETGICIECGFN
jgi:hypothetical protein